MRYFEDFTPGEVITHDGIDVAEQEVLDFANKFDPQNFHIDAQAAADSIYGGLIASGWHTAAMTMRMLCESYLLDTASMGSPGVDEIRWRAPVRPGDKISLRLTIRETRRSRSKPDRGLIYSDTEILNQHGDIVMTFSSMGLIRTRNQSATATKTETDAS